MEKGKIEKSFLGEMVMVYADYTDDDKVTFRELPLHPHFKNYIFREGQEMFFHYGKECTIHYPKLCGCLKMQLYAIPIFKKQKLNFKYILKQIFKQIFK